MEGRFFPILKYPRRNGSQQVISEYILFFTTTPTPIPVPSHLYWKTKEVWNYLNTSRLPRPRYASAPTTCYSLFSSSAVIFYHFTNENAYVHICHGSWQTWTNYIEVPRFYNIVYWHLQVCTFFNDTFRVNVFS